MAVSRAGTKGRTKVLSTGRKTPGYWLSPVYFQTIKRMLAPDWAQKILCIIVPNRRTASPEFFSWVRTRRLLTRSRLVWLMHQRNARSQETFSLILTLQFKILSTRKLKTLFQKYKLELITGIHPCINHTFLNIQEIKMPWQLTAMKTLHEKWIHILSVSIVIIPTRITYFVNASELFWSWISINHIQVHEEKETFVIASLRLSQNVKLGIFIWQSCSDSKEMYKKVWCTCKVVVCLIKPLLFLLSRCRCISNFPLFMIHCDPSETEFSQCKLNCSW